MEAELSMGPLEGVGGSNMAPFLTKLFQIVSASTTDPCITWTSKGDSFVISDPDGFARDILPTYFKHNNIRSFIRQLNTYGFRKRTNISSSDEHLEFFHIKFRRDEPQLLTQIKRCHQPKPQARGGGGNGAGEEVLELEKNSPDIDTIRNRVGELKSRLTSLQSEIRDYNSQMEQKVNLLMHILQTAATPQAAQLQQIARLQQLSNNNSSGQGMQSGQGQTASGGYNGMDTASPYSSMRSVQHDILARRDPLMASLGGQAGLGNMAASLGIPGLGGMGGLGSGMGGGLGGLAGSNLMANFRGLNALGGQKAGVEGGVAGLQHLLEAAQRSQDYSQDGSKGEHAAKRFRTEAPTTQQPEEAHA